MNAGRYAQSRYGARGPEKLRVVCASRVQSRRRAGCSGCPEFRSRCAVSFAAPGGNRPAPLIFRPEVNRAGAISARFVARAVERLRAKSNRRYDAKLSRGRPGVVVRKVDSRGWNVRDRVEMRAQRRNAHARWPRRAVRAPSGTLPAAEVRPLAPSGTHRAVGTGGRHVGGAFRRLVIPGSRVSEGARIVGPAIHGRAPRSPRGSELDARSSRKPPRPMRTCGYRPNCAKPPDPGGLVVVARPFMAGRRGR
jgi:hypothetical protein